MKNVLKFAMILGVALVSYSQAGVLKFSYKHALKPAAKVASFPVRHPKKSAHGLEHGAKKSAHVAKKVLF